MSDGQTVSIPETLQKSNPGSSPLTLMDEDLDDYLMDYEPSLACDGMDINVIYLSSTDYSLLGEEEMSQLALGLQDAIFK